jgi:hypothetical protein
VGGGLKRAGLVAVAIALLCAGAASAADPFYGIYTESSHDVPATVDAQVARQAATGAGLVREPLDWSAVERTPGKYDWSRFDAVVVAAAARGITVLPTIWSPPAFRSSKPAGSTKNGMWPPAKPRDMAVFARKAIARYGPRGSLWCASIGPIRLPSCKRGYRPIRAWMVWNEPDIASFWPAGPDPSGYATLLRTTARAIRLADRGAEIVLGGLSIRGTSPGGYLDRLYDTGAMRVVDTLATHPYGRSVGAMLDRVTEVRRIADAHGDSAKPIRATEYGWATGGKQSIDQVVSERCQAALMNAATLALAARRTTLNLAGIVAFNWTDRPTTSTIWPFFTGLINVDGSPKPALAAFTSAVAGVALAPEQQIAAVCTSTHLALETDPDAPRTY